MDDTLDSAIDRQTYLRVGYALLAGLLLSVSVMVLGLVLTVARGGDTSTVLPLERVMPALGRGEAPAVLDLGILLLFATPLIGVFVACAEFLRQRDRTFAATTGLLLVMLVIAFGVALH